MATQEFYIRNESDTEARGPFTLEQLASLVDAGQVTPATLYYETATEEWITIEATQNLKASLFPEKKKLSLRNEPKIATVNQAHEADRPITVNDMLAAAEGRTEDTKDKQDPTIAMAKAASFGRVAAIVMLLVSAAGGLLPAADLVIALDVAKLATSPLAILGVVDLLLAVLLALGVVSIYPLVRFRAALGFGFLGFLFWSQGLTTPLLAAAAGSAGLFLSTVFVSFAPVLIAAVLGIAGFGFVAWHLLSSAA
ncbi:MAG: DUF4339 domain-containing protein [Opitutus sp.]|nr:DUF4339 domain-containing protein [Opitutus sp.]